MTGASRRRTATRARRCTSTAVPEAKYLDEFDEWASRGEPIRDSEATAYRNWTRSAPAELEDDGVVAEVIFPNTIPPSFPSGNLLAAAEND
jgi:hypothetical protein